MPVGIQMFATIHQPHHYTTLQRDLASIVSSDSYYDTTVHCSDGVLRYSRLILGLVLPELTSVTSFSFLPEVNILMPQYRRSEVERMVGSLLSLVSNNGEEANVMTDWSDSIDTIIDNLKPESANSKDAPRTATLHSEVTKETVVLHAANEDETDDVLVVNEDHGSDDHNNIDISYRTRTSGHHIQPMATTYPNTGLNIPVVQQGVMVEPAPIMQSQTLRYTATTSTKPPTYVPIPSKKDKTNQRSTKSNMSPSVSTSPGSGHVPPSSLSPHARSIVPIPVRQRQHTQIQLKKSPVKVDQKSRPALTKVSKIEINSQNDISLPHVDARRPQPRTTEIRPVHVPSSPPSPRKHVSKTDTNVILSPSAPAKPTPTFPCPVCHKMFVGQDIMETHMKLHSDKHKCQTCGLVFIKARELIEHQRIHSGAKLVKCNICDKDFTEKGLRLHSERFHKILEVKAQNKRASKENVNYFEDKITFTSSSDESDTNVDDPDEVSSEEEEVEPKQKKVRLKVSRNVKLKRTELCEECNKSFTVKGLKLHKMRYHKSDNNKDEALKRLVRDKTKKNPPLKKLFSCGYCEKKFSHLASMKVHEKVHLGGKPHQCDMCDAKFSNKFDLFAHEKSHSASRPHKCDECTETFKTAESLRFHKLIHEESQPNVCQYCKKTFKNRNQLELHERVHIGEKPFNCTQCEQSFETASKLTRHITSTHMNSK